MSKEENLNWQIEAYLRRMREKRDISLGQQFILFPQTQDGELEVKEIYESFLQITGLSQVPTLADLPNLWLALKAEKQGEQYEVSASFSLEELLTANLIRRLPREQETYELRSGSLGDLLDAISLSLHVGENRYEGIIETFDPDLSPYYDPKGLQTFQELSFKFAKQEGLTSLDLLIPQSQIHTAAGTLSLPPVML